MRRFHSNNSSTMLTKAKKLISDPGKYANLGLRMVWERAACLFQSRSFFLQGQMNIHPRSGWHSPEFIERTGGFFPRGRGVGRRICNLEAHDNTRRDMLILLLRTLTERNVDGDMAEVGVYKGYTSRLLHHYAPERKLHLFDTFQGFGERSTAKEKEHVGFDVRAKHFHDTSLDLVKRNIAPRNDNLTFYVGYFPDTVTEDLEARTFAFVHLDADLYEPTIEGLRFFYPRTAVGGFLVVHDYNAWPGARQAVDEFFEGRPEVPIPMPDKSGSALITKQ